MAFLQGNLALVLGVVALILTLGVQRFVRDEVLKRDVGGAAVLFAVYVALRLSGGLVAELVPDDWHPWVRVTWMLAFAFGTVRFGVALALGVRRRFAASPGAKIQRDVLDFVLYVVCAVPILKTQLKIDVGTLLGTSAVLSLVLGLGLQETLTNLFAGLSLQFERPFVVGDFIRVGEHEGRVVQVAWRSTRLETVRREVVSVPNSLVAKAHVVSYSANRAVAIDLEVSASYAAPPNLVKGEVLETLREAPSVLADPAPWVRVASFGDSGVVYAIRVFMADYASVPQVRDEVLARLWYRFNRAGIEIPFPQTVVHLRQGEDRRAPLAQELLARLELFAPFAGEELAAIAGAAHERRFGAGEEIVTEGREGSTFFVVVSGRVGIRGGQPPREVAVLGRGQSFGEMSLLTGEPRAATVTALEDATLLELGREVFATHFAAHPERAQQIAEVVSRRKAELSAALPADTNAPVTESARVLARLREIFRLRA
jgi:small-conductance mechanosensitive channel/CRP-like cAMP-binding protein